MIFRELLPLLIFFAGFAAGWAFKGFVKDEAAEKILGDLDKELRKKGDER